MSAHEFGDFTVSVAAKPVNGVTDVEIPPKLAEFLAKEVPTVLKNSGDKELHINAASEKDAKLLAGYARAWGARQERKLYIKKLPNGKSLPETVARLSVAYDDEVPADNRAGRKAGK